ncbi:hypothetical protein SNEBB_003140 [Seison nebaliae]|nr:hypothetical protein SNEBB_003140 [Seison nebaliae]
MLIIHKKNSSSNDNGMCDDMENPSKFSRDSFGYVSGSEPNVQWNERTQTIDNFSIDLTSSNFSSIVTRSHSKCEDEDDEGENDEHNHHDTPIEIDNHRIDDVIDIDKMEMKSIDKYYTAVS